jgi:predicted nuclease of predicted toxin-antitoxin system
VKLLVDMNLSPSWVERLARHGFDAVHWSTIGAVTAPDVEILTWANERHFVVLTNDLDFSAILAAGAVDGPSVVQLRAQDLMSAGAARIVATALEAQREDLRAQRRAAEDHAEGRSGRNAERGQRQQEVARYRRPLGPNKAGCGGGI